MTANLVIWKWSEDYAKPYARKKEKLTMGSVVKEFMISEDETKFGSFDQRAFEEAAIAELANRGFSAENVLIENYDKCMVFNMTLRVSDQLIPLIGTLAMKHGLNGTEA